MPSISLSPETYARTVRLKATHAFPSMNAAVAHSLDDHDRMHVTVPPVPIPPTPTPVPPPAPIPTTVREQLIIAAVPRDRLNGATIHTLAGDISVSQYIGAIAPFGPAIDTAFALQGAPDIRHRWTVLWYPMQESLDDLQTTQPQFPVGDPERYYMLTRPNGERVYTRDKWGEGCSWGKVLDALGKEPSMKYAAQALARKQRAGVFLVGAGGFAGGMTDLTGGKNRGVWVVSDYEVVPFATGKLHPRQIEQNEIPARYKAASHEIGHGNSCFMHAGDCWPEWPDLECIHKEFTSYWLPTPWRWDDPASATRRLRQWTEAEINADAGLKNHLAWEGKLYEAQRRMLRRDNAEWLVS